MRILIETREVYGRTLAYPANETAEWAAKMSNTKTITRNTLLCLLRMGATVVLVSRGAVIRQYAPNNNTEACELATLVQS